MGGDGCACKEPGPAVSSGSPCGSGSERGVIVWDPLALAGSALQVSEAFALSRANALEFAGVVIGAGGAIQTVLQAQGSSDGVNWTNLGSSVQLLALGNTASPVITGMSFRWFRIAAQNQTANTVVVAARLSCA